MKLTHKLNLLSFTILVSSCGTFAPQYNKPQVMSLKEARNGTKFESSNLNLSEIKWWLKLNDPVLNKLLANALANNNQILAAKNNILQAQAKLKAAQYSWLPTLGATGGGFAGNSWGTNLTPQSSLSQTLPAGSINNSNFSGYYGGFEPSYSLNIFSNINQERLAKASLEQQQAYLNAARLSVIGQTTGAYFMLLGLNKQLLLQQQMINDLTLLRSLQANRVNIGKSDPSEIYTIDKQIDQAKANLPAIHNSIAQTENAIQLLQGENPDKVETSQKIDEVDITGLVPTNLPSSVLYNRPDIMIAEYNLKIANANIGLARSVFFPSINLTGLVGGASVALSNLFNVSTGFWAIQAAASMPILNASSFEEIKAADNEYYVAYYNYMQTVKAAFADVDNNLTNQQTSNQSYTSTVKYSNDVKQLYRVINNKYQAGKAGYIDLIKQKIDMDNAMLTVNQAKMQQLDSIVNLYQAIAGGYIQ